MLSRHCISTNDSQQDCFVCSLLRGNKPKERFDHMEVHRQVWSAWDSLSVVRQIGWNGNFHNVNLSFVSGLSLISLNP